jgi:LysM repeat protein
MVLASAYVRCLVLTAIVVGWCGCGLVSKSSLDEQKDPHYLTGKNRINSLDHKGAAEAFEKALETNPRSASAHFELGILYMQRLTNYAAAIYHFERFLSLRPQSEHGDFVRQHITACKQELARTVPLGPVTPAMQRELARLAEENLRLHQQVDFLNRRMAEATNTWIAPPGTPGSTSIVPSVVVNPPPPSSSVATSLPPRELTRPAPSLVLTNAASVQGRIHVVQRNETLAAVARKYGIKLSALQAANPRVNPRQMKVGQTLVVPSK